MLSEIIKLWSKSAVKPSSYRKNKKYQSFKITNNQDTEIRVFSVILIITCDFKLDFIFFVVSVTELVKKLGGVMWILNFLEEAGPGYRVANEKEISDDSKVPRNIVLSDELNQISVGIFRHILKNSVGIAQCEAFLVFYGEKVWEMGVLLVWIGFYYMQSTGYEAYPLRHGTRKYSLRDSVVI